jgi:hypothetical protein
MSGAYSVVVNGEIADGFDLAQVKKTVAAQFKLSDAQIEKVFSGKPVSIRRGIDKEQALKLSAALAKAGAVAAVKRAAVKPPAPEKPTSAANNKNVLPVSAADISCPRCGHTQSFSQACSMCKMDFALHIKRLARKEKMREFRQQNKA